MVKPCFRGELYYADLGKGIGSEQEGFRPVVIIQNNVGNKHSPTTIVAAISTQIKTKARLPTHYYLKAGNGLLQPSVVMLEQIRTIDKNRLEQYIGTLPEKEICRMDRALAVSIGLMSAALPKIKLCLCRTCADNLVASGAYKPKRTSHSYNKPELCAYCNHNYGQEYVISHR